MKAWNGRAAALAVLLGAASAWAGPFDGKAFDGQDKAGWGILSELIAQGGQRPPSAAGGAVYASAGVPGAESCWPLAGSPGAGEGIELPVWGEILGFSPDGMSLLWVDRQNAALVDLKSGKPVLRAALPDPNMYDLRILKAKSSPDGRWIALLGSRGHGGDVESVGLWQMGTGKVDWSKPVREWIETIGFSPDSRRLLLATYGKVYSFDIESRETAELHTLATPLSGRDAEWLGLKGISPDGKKFVAENRHTSLIHVWDAERDRHWTLRHPSQFGGYFHAAFSPDGRYFAAAPADVSPGILTLLDMDQDRQSAVPLQERISELEFSVDGKRVLARGYRKDKLVAAVDAATQTEIKPRRPDRFRNDRLSPDAKTRLIVEWYGWRNDRRRFKLERMPGACPGQPGGPR